MNEALKMEDAKAKLPKAVKLTNPIANNEL